MANLTNRQKHLLADIVPTYGGCATRKEVKEAKQKFRGLYFDIEKLIGETEFCSISPDGQRYFFQYEWEHPAGRKRMVFWKKEARRAARLWSKGFKKEAICIESYAYS